MKEFLKKAAQWLLQREEELAKKCAINLEDLDRQIKTMEEKKEELERQCRENLDEMERIIVKLRWIKAEEMKRCDASKESDSEGKDQQ